MDDELARRLDRITLLLGALVIVQALLLFAVADLSLAGLVVGFVAAGALVALVGGALTDRNPFRGSDRPRAR